MDTRICPVTTSPADLQALVMISRISFSATFGSHHSLQALLTYLNQAYAPAKLARELTRSTSRTFFLLAWGQPVGYLKLNWGPTQTEPNFPAALEVQRIYLLPAYQGQRLGDQLMRFALDYARHHGFHQVWLGVWQHNDRAQQFYRRWGFRPDATHQFTIGADSQTDDLLLKNI